MVLYKHGAEKLSLFYIKKSILLSALLPNKTRNLFVLIDRDCTLIFYHECINNIL